MSDCRRSLSEDDLRHVISRRAILENVLITGVSGGIGKACAEKLLSEGHSVIGLDLDVTDLKESFAEEYRDQICLYSVNLLEVDAISGLLKQIVKERGGFGGFVHCAGYDKMAPLGVMKTADIESLWRIHALVPIHIISILSKKKFHNKGMNIVLITSQSAHEGAMGHCAYAAAKGAIEGFLAPAAAELMEKGIRINEVCFAPIKTKMAESWMTKLTPEELENLMKTYPLGLGEPENAAELIYFLLSDKSRFINGQIITADGGHSVRKV